MKAFPRHALPITAAILLLSFTLAACGIDEFVYLYPVTNVGNNPTDSDDDSYKFFSFVTRDSDNDSEASGYFQGWEIYYRIYNSVSDRSVDTTAIETKIDDDPANAWSEVINTRKYKRMTLIQGSDTASLLSAPLLKGTSSDRAVTIRPLTLASYPAEFTVDGVQITGSGGADSFAWRSVTAVKAKSFDYDEIETSDADVKYNSSYGTDEWYLQAYVFAYGFDTSYKALYSEPKSLGSITIAQ